MPNDNEEILSCPFCGVGMSVCDTDYDDTAKRWRVWCGKCGASSGVSPRAEGSKEAAIKSWNTRGGKLAYPVAVAETGPSESGECQPPAGFSDPLSPDAEK